ncbi:unnamed protein product [Symbiodinium sp. CCMP2592]|nr:unnamed protein product [Symbiodinium sp. CCMP2592]
MSCEDFAARFLYRWGKRMADRKHAEAEALRKELMEYVKFIVKILPDEWRARVKPEILQRLASKHGPVGEAGSDSEASMTYGPYGKEDLHRLAAHHSQPLFRELRDHMGRNKPQWGKERDAYYGRSEHGWSEHGWPPSHGKGKEKGKDKGKDKRQPSYTWQTETADFPTYDMMETSRTRGQPSRPAEAEAANRVTTGGAIKVVQKIVNGVRRNETRLRKMDEEAEEAAAKWKAFQEKLKKSFITERARYMASKEQFAKVKAEVQEMLAQNLQDLQDFLVNPDQYQAKMEVDDTPTEALAAWEALMTEPAETEADGISGLLKGPWTIQGRTWRGDNPAPQDWPSPSADSTRSDQICPAPMTPTDGEVARTLEGAMQGDPYMTSPSLAGAMPSVPETRRSRPRSTAPRTAIKSVGKDPGPANTGGASLAEKLDRKRQQAADAISIEEDEEEDLIGDLSRATAGAEELFRHVLQRGSFFGLSAYALRAQFELGTPGPPKSNTGVGWRRPTVLDGALWPSAAVPNGLRTVGTDFDLGCRLPSLLHQDLRRGHTYDGAFEQVADPRPLLTWHGPSGGHDHFRLEHHDIYDFLDVTDYAYGRMAWWASTMLEVWADTAQAIGNTLRLIWLLSSGALLWAQANRRRPLVKDLRRRPHSLPLRVLAATILPHGVHAAPYPRQLQQTYSPDWRRPTDLELWAAGQLTGREQLLNPAARLAYETPVCSGGLLPGHVYPDGPPMAQPMPPEQFDDVDLPLEHDHEIQAGEIRAEHISFWVGSPGWEPESLDVALSFPVNDHRVREIVQDSVRHLSHPWLNDIFELTPQLHHDYGSFVLVPEWVRHSAKRVVVIDGQRFDKGVQAFYFSGPVTRFLVLSKIGIDPDAAAEVYVGGAAIPLAHHASKEVDNGCLVQVLQTGDQVGWAGDLRDRFQDPTMWRPATQHPAFCRDRFVEFQSGTHQYTHRLRREDRSTPTEIAGEAFELEPDAFWLRAPTNRPTGMFKANRRIHSVVAVVQDQYFNRDRASIITLDLRPIGQWVQWVAVESELFYAGDYIAALQLPVVDGFSVVIHGGTKTRTPGAQRVNDGDVLEVTLTRSDDITPSESSDGDNDSDAGGDDESDEEGQSTAADLRADTTMKSDRLLKRVLPPASFDISARTVALPHTVDDVKCLLRPWPPDWMQEVCLPTLPPTTERAMAQMCHWADIIGSTVVAKCPEIHLYVDGSWTQQLQVGGYAVAIFLVTTGSMALFGLLGEPTQGNPDTPWQHEDAPALRNEQTAMMAAVLWCLQSRSFISPAAYHLFYDCAAAGKAATGEWDASDDFGLRLRHVTRLLQDLSGVPVYVKHVKAHDEHPLNELVDTLAKEVSKGHVALSKPPRCLCEMVQSTDLSWLPVVAQQISGDAYPIQAGCQLQWDETIEYGRSTLTSSQLIPATGEGRHCHEPTRIGIQAKFFSLNAQTLSGRYKYYEEQLMTEKVQIACFQETRGAEGATESKNFLRLASDSKSHWGEADIRVVTQTPRLMILSIDIGGPRVVVVAGHCPDASKGDAAREFLATFGDAMKPLRRSCLILCGFDLNGRLPTGQEGHTGDLEFGTPDWNGELMVRTARTLDLWFPSTYAALHPGPSATFTHAQGTRHRIDYAIIGGIAEIGAVRSSVATDFDTLNMNDDHQPVLIELQGTITTAIGREQIWRPRFDTEKMLTPEGKATIAQALTEFESPQWGCHPDQHCQSLQDFLLGVMERNFKCDDRGPRTSYIAPDIWALREAKLALKTRARHRASLWSSLLSRAFRQWGAGEEYGVIPLVAKQGMIYEIIAAAVNYATLRIKKGIRQGKNAFLDRVAKGGAAKASEILSTVKRVGIGGRQAKTYNRPPPKLLAPDGTIAASRAARDEIWLDQFSRQECGEIVDTAKYLGRPWKPVIVDMQFDWNLEEIPSFFEVETAFRHAPMRKSCGLDHLPGELLRADPAGMAKAAFPLFLKATLSLRQPAQWRGGLLREAWKKKGPIQDPASYRSLFVSSMLGKTYHKVLRARATQYTADMLLGFQMGTRKQAPVTLPSLYIQAHLRRGVRERLSTAVLFLDVQSAYYTVIRDMSVGPIESPEVVAKLFQYFSLDQADLAEFWGDIQQGGVMGQSTMPPSLRHLAKDTMHQSWFVTGYGTSSRVCVTQAASRPGEAWADLVFAFVLGKILCRIREAAAGEDLLQVLHHDGECGPYAKPGDGEEVQALECAWADDAAFPTADRAPEKLLAKASRLCSVVLHECARHGLQPNLRPGKTALLLVLRGPGSRKARQKWFPQGQQSLALPDLGVEVPVVGAYTHLGALVDCAMSLQGEAKRRLAIAQSSFDEGKKLLYANSTIPLATRTGLFLTGFLATMFNLGTWVPEGHAWQRMAGGFTRILKGLLTKMFPGELLYNVAAPAAWLAVVRTDLDWLLAGAEDCPPANASGWPELHALLRHRTEWIKRRVRHQLKRDFEAFCEEQLANLQLWALYRRLCASLPATALCEEWVCRPCGRRVRTRAALGAHFFKTHGRQAQHRRFVAGSICRACGRQYWTQQKLATHLRDHPGCVATLQAHGMGATTVAPGRGSRAWRKATDDTYSLAVPKQCQAPLPDIPQRGWEQCVTEAYQDLCDVLLEYDLPADPQAIHDKIACQLGRHPLFADEEDLIVDYVDGEVAALRDARADEHWSDSVYSALRIALQGYKDRNPLQDDTTSSRPASDSLYDFSRRLQTYDWQDALARARCPHVTPDKAFFELDSREAAKACPSEVLTVAAVEEKYWPLVPMTLQHAWDAALQGAEVRLKAPHFPQHEGICLHIIRLRTYL